VQRLLRADPRLLDAPDRYGRTPLVCAGQQHKLSVVHPFDDLASGSAPFARRCCSWSIRPP
jgi:hypothetical protein